jgi:hypothetical protein
MKTKDDRKMEELTELGYELGQIERQTKKEKPHLWH